MKDQKYYEKKLFSFIWCGGKIKGAFKADAYCEHKIFIRIGGMLVRGSSDRLEYIYAIVPGNAKLDIPSYDSRANMSITPGVINGKLVDVSENITVQQLFTKELRKLCFAALKEERKEKHKRLKEAKEKQLAYEKEQQAAVDEILKYTEEDE